jgi:hypothetical protein
VTAAKLNSFAVSPEPSSMRAQQLECPVDWLVRAAHNRCLPNSDKLWPHATEGAPLGEIEFALAARPGASSCGHAASN